MENIAHPDRGAGLVFPLVQAYLADQLGALLAHESGLLERGDPEAIHQLRVATRRILAVLPILGKGATSHLAGEFKRLLRNSGMARDTDVLIDSLGDGSRRHRNLSRHLTSAREGSRQTLVEFVQSKRYTKLKSALGELLDQTADSTHPISCDEAVRVILSSQLPPIKQLCHRACSTKKRAREKDLHRLRIRLKRLRYVFELFVPVYGDALSAFLKRLGKLQTKLGDFHDACVAMGKIDRFRKDQKKTGSKLRKLRRKRSREAAVLRSHIRKKELPRFRQSIRKKQLRKVFGELI